MHRVTESSRIWVHTLSDSCCISIGGRSSCTFTPRATDMTARAHSIRCTLFKWSSMNWVAGRLKADSNLRILKRGNIISDQCPMAVCRAARFANPETLFPKSQDFVPRLWQTQVPCGHSTSSERQFVLSSRRCLEILLGIDGIMTGNIAGCRQAASWRLNTGCTL